MLNLCLVSAIFFSMSCQKELVRVKHVFVYTGFMREIAEKCVLTIPALLRDGQVQPYSTVPEFASRW